MSKVGPFTRKILLGCAIFVDVLQFLIGFIPGIGQVINIFISILAYLFFGILLAIFGIPLLPTNGDAATRKMTKVLINLIADFIPIVKMFWPSFFIIIETLTKDK